MTHIAKILPRSNVVLELDASSKQSAFEQISEVLEKNCSIARATVLENLLAREALGSTGLGHGVAIPHGRIKGLKSAMAALVRLKTPILFDSPDGKPVNLLIVVLIPDNVTQQHLEILSWRKCFQMRCFAPCSPQSPIQIQSMRASSPGNPASEPPEHLPPRSCLSFPL